MPQWGPTNLQPPDAPTLSKLHHSHRTPPTLLQAAQPEEFSLVLLLCSLASHLLLVGQNLDLFDAWYSKPSLRLLLTVSLQPPLCLSLTLGKFGSFPLYGK